MATTRLVPARRRAAAPLFTPFRPFDDPRGLLDVVDAAFAGLDSPRFADAWTPAVTVEETDGAYRVEAELPGIKREDVTVELDEKILHIHGETTETERTGKVRHQTRRTGKFDYRLRLPQEVNADAVTATLTDGVLTLELAKSVPTGARQITISDESPAVQAETTQAETTSADAPETPLSGATESEVTES
ncbi:Hsp20/alpha crystallin family protein [Gordonia sp. VNQ95]|uniref:Hsp20/alpha crystallin family protein n=1 Tax=Gordonia sp. VNQ95 TaxID=3156619 RepID=UPI0032B3FB3B